jgi:hypothetical protein
LAFISIDQHVQSFGFLEQDCRSSSTDGWRIEATSKIHQAAFKPVNASKNMLYAGAICVGYFFYLWLRP